MRIGFYPGSFDPLTHGHLDIIRQACRLVDRLVIGIGINSAKMPVFSEDERQKLIMESCQELVDVTRIETVIFNGLAIDAAKNAGAGLMIRGLRDSADLNDEMRLAGMNAVLAPDLQIVFIPSSVRFRPVSATLVRQVAMMGGDVSPFVPENVAAALRAKFP